MDRRATKSLFGDSKLARNQNAYLFGRVGTAPVFGFVTFGRVSCPLSIVGVPSTDGGFGGLFFSWSELFKMALWSKGSDLAWFKGKHMDTIHTLRIQSTTKPILLVFFGAMFASKLHHRLEINWSKLTDKLLQRLYLSVKRLLDNWVHAFNNLRQG